MLMGAWLHMRHDTALHAKGFLLNEGTDFGGRSASRAALVADCAPESATGGVPVCGVASTS
jgi:hypothetical protein